MKVLGIVSEYNPFHNGHLYHLEESIKAADADYTICVMSGNFLQRGEPALFDKWIRAEAAIKGGIDVVLELPTVFACSSAEYFAKGAIEILNHLGCVTHLGFGSEHSNLDDLLQLAHFLAHPSDTYKSILTSHLDKGLSYAKANQLSVEKLSPLSHIICEPNNILAIEYLKQLLLLKSAMQPIAIKRKQAHYHDTSISADICSATAIRNHLKVPRKFDDLHKVIPLQIFNHFKSYIDNGIKPLFISDFYKMIQYKILTSTAGDLRRIYTVKEGLEYRILNYFRKSLNYKELAMHIKTKRYPLTSIQRLLIHILLNISKSDVQSILNQRCLYGRVLALSIRGSKLIRHIKEQECHTLPIISNINKGFPKKSRYHDLLKYDIAASDLYTLVSQNPNLYFNSDYVKRPFIES